MDLRTDGSTWSGWWLVFHTLDVTKSEERGLESRKGLMTVPISGSLP